MKIVRTANYKKIAQIPPVQPSQPMQFSKRQFNDKQNQSPQSANDMVPKDSWGGLSGVDF